MATSSCTIADLTCCAICLESFTRPKVLPCQHTYCYSCLMSLVRDDKVITCPQCRDVHAVPKGGIAAFKDNFIVNDLLSMNPSEGELCTDCKLKPAVSPCEHCNANMCVTCIVEHAKLSMELKMSLNELKGAILMPKTAEKQKMLEVSKNKCNEKLTDLKIAYERQLREIAAKLSLLLTSSSSLINIMKVIIRAHDDMLQSTSEQDVSNESYFIALVGKLDKCKTLESMKDLRNDVSDFRNVVRLIQNSEDNFRIVPEKDAPLGRIGIGQSVVNFRGNPGTDVSVEDIIERLSDLGAGNRNTESPELSTHISSERRPDVVPCPRSRDKESGDSIQRLMESIPPNAIVEASDIQVSASGGTCFQAPSSCVRPSLSGRTPTSAFGPTQLNQPLLHSNNKFPRNVDYRSKGKGWIPIIGQGKNVEISKRLFDPYALAYHESMDDFFVADNGNGRVMAYKSDGSHARIFCIVTCPCDIAISTDGSFVFVAAGKSFRKYELSGNCVKTIKRCSLGAFQSCCAVDCHKDCAVVGDEELQCVFVYDQNEREIRRFGQRYLERPGCIGVSIDGTMYITDDRREIKVFKWNGQYLNTFLSSDEVAFEEVAVDGDGFVCVTNLAHDRIDVYDPTKSLVATIGGPGERPGRLRYPTGVCFMPHGQLVVLDNANNRLQVF